MIRVRHYTRVSSRDKILAENLIVAQDQNCVFFEFASLKPMSAQKVLEKYLLKRGKGSAYIEFDADAAEIGSQPNQLRPFTEYFIVGNVDLTDRNPIGFENR